MTMNQNVNTPNSAAKHKGMPDAAVKYSPFPYPKLDDRTACKAHRKGTNLVFGRFARR